MAGWSEVRGLTREVMYASLWLICIVLQHKPREHCKVILLLKNKLKKKKTAIHKIIHAKKKNPVVQYQMEVIWPLIQTISLVVLKKQVVASLVTQRAKHLPAMQETWVRSLGREDPWRRKQQPTPVLLPGESHGWKSLVSQSPWVRKESDMTERLHFLFSSVAQSCLILRPRGLQHARLLCPSPTP